ncbi:alpha/beta fold hydrolase [Algoriphagus antarcticus]|uniref:Pimeloyl-ACP methyl ester carboxylesterase n=1 Tax=Algoriphagus antarcticus TaxID=238540 RepID=A0A3E0DYE5_9BACT|nr:alpha/beta hydrolase [Algoriphagus antarcticus]REG88599.1 pimeloyl-ACP methyl ester carboxylesterase [Algoriphagus antarcticus]
MKKSLILYFLLFGLVTYSFAQTSFETKVSGSGPIIILIPGLASSGDVWQETVAELSKTNECHILTLPGFAGQPATDLSAGFLSEIKTEIAKYIQQLDQPVSLIGHSLGGFLSLQLANEYPDLISKAVIVDSYPFYSAAINPTSTVEMMKPMAKQMKITIENLSAEDFEKQQMASMPIMTATESRIPELVEWSMKSDQGTVSQAIYELMTTDYRPNLKSLETPILVLGAWYSGKDYGMTAESVKDNFELQYQLAENVQIKMAPTAHHFIMWDNPEWFMTQIQNFVK